MEQDNSKRQEHSAIDTQLQKYLLPFIVAAAFIVIVFGLIIRAQTQLPASAGGSQNAVVEATPSPEPTPVPQTPQPTEHVYTIVVDAGHGGFDPGAPGASGSREDEINLSIALKVEAALSNAGYNVIMTRSDGNALAGDKDSDLEKRVEITKQADADMLISIHQNSYPSDTSVRGPEVYYLSDENTAAKTLAQDILDALNKHLEVARPRSIHIQDLVVLKAIPLSVLVECGFISCPEEEAALLSDEYGQKIADAILEGVENYLGESN